MVDIPRQVRVVLAAVFVGSLAAVVVAGIIWAYNPVGSGGLTFRPDTVPLDSGADGAAAEVRAEPSPTGGEAGQDEEAEEAEPEPSPTPTPTPTEDAEELVAAAADPADTTVQVLDAGGGSAATEAAVEALRELGYRVTNVTSSRTDVERTTVWYTEDNEPEARALRARDGRFAEVGPNERLNEGTNVHVLVGPDWQD